MKKISITIRTLAALSLLLPACSVGRKYSRTELELPAQYRQQLPLTADTVSLPWKAFFKDPQLVALVHKALEKNTDIRVAMLSLRQTELSYKQAKLQLLPSVDLTAGTNRNWLSQNSLNGSLSQQFAGTNYMDDFNAAINLSWEADIWGKAKMQKEEARANYFMQKENLDALRTRIIAEVAQAYYNLVSLDEQLRVAVQNTDLSENTLQMIRLQYRSAQASSVAVEQAEAQKKTAELLIPLAKQNIAIQENAISILCGVYPDSIGRAASLDQAMPEAVFATGVPAVLLSRRPDVKAAEYAVMAANSRSGLAKANMYPSFTLTASAGANSFKFSNWFDLPGSLVKNLGVGLTQPVFRKRALKTAYDVALLEQEKSAQQFRQTVLVAVGEVSDALATLAHSDARLSLTASKGQSLGNATRDATALYKSAMASYLEVITAQNNALQNDLDAIAIKREKMQALTKLYRALGGGTDAR